MATRYTSLGIAALIAGSIGANVYTASTAQSAREAMSAAHDITTRHGELVVRVDAGGADVTALAAVTPGTPAQVLTVSDSGVPVWRGLPGSVTLAGTGVVAVYAGDAGTVDAAGASDASMMALVNGVPQWVQSYASTGVDTSRPAAATALIGQVYTATDTGASYRCESDGAGGARWRNVATGNLDSVAFNCSSATRQQISETTHAPLTTATLVVIFAATATPGSVSAMLGNYYGGGWQMEIGNNAGDRGLLSLYRSGLTPARQELTGATVTGALGVGHAVAIAMTQTSIKWSFDGGAVQTGSATTGTATGTVAWWICSSAATIYYQAVRVLGEEASDADLQTLSGASTISARRIPAVASATTVLIDWHACRVEQGALGSRIAGSQADYLYANYPARLVGL